VGKFPNVDAKFYEVKVRISISYRPLPYLHMWDHIGHKKCPYRPQTISAKSISATGP